jgi:hypothetical protein
LIDAARLQRGAAWLLALLAALVWHVLLPPMLAGNPASYLEGPLPAVLGAAAGLWLHQRAPTWLAVLAACAFAMLGLLLAILTVGLVVFGPMGALRGIGQWFASLYPSAFIALPRLLGSPYLLWAVWVAGKTLLAWGALAYLGAILMRREGREWLRWRWRDLTQSHAFRRDQKQRLREYRQAFLVAVNSGQPPPPRPPELVPDVAMGGGGAQAAYWLLRIGYFLVGGTLFWWAFGDYLALIAHRLAGPTPWWWGLGR